MAVSFQDMDDHAHDDRGEPVLTGRALSSVRYHGGVRRPKWSGYTAFVLSGGGARGALQVGMLRALLEHGERPDLIVGTSIGAWNGAWLARNPTLEGIEGLTNIWKSLTPARVLLGRDPYGNPPARAVSAMLMLAAVQRVTQGNASLYGDTGLHHMAHDLIGDLTFEDLILPLRVVAANLTDGGRAIFSGGKLAPAVLASSAIPGIFPPVRIDDRVYVDGGALENASLDIAVEMGARRLFVLDVGYDISSSSDVRWPGELISTNSKVRGNGPHPLAAVLERTAQVMSNYHLTQALMRLPPGIETHTLRPEIPNGWGGTLDFGRSAEWIEHAYDVTRAYLRAELPVAEPAPVPARADGSALDEMVDEALTA